MAMQDVLPLLERHPFSRDFQPQQIRLLAGEGRVLRFAADEVLFREGDPCSDFYLMLDGSLALEMVVGDRVLRIQTLEAGDEFGVSSLIGERGTHFQVRALKPVVAMAFDSSRLLEACRDDPRFGFVLMRRLLRLVSSRLDATQVQLSDTFSPVAHLAGA